MAEQGFILDIDARFLANLQKADAALKEASRSSGTLTSAFSQMVNSGQTFTKQIEAIRGRLESLKHIKIEDAGGFTKITTDARTMTDQINLLTANMREYERELERIRKTSRSKDGLVGGIPMMIGDKGGLYNMGELTSAIKMLEEIQKSGVYGSGALTPRQNQYINEQVALYKSAIAELKKTDDQRIQEVINGANQEIAEIKKKADAVQSIELTAAQKRAQAQKQLNSDIRNSISISKNVGTSRELSGIISEMERLQGKIKVTTKAGQAQFHRLAKAIDDAKKRLQGMTINRALSGAGDARTVNEMRNAISALQAAKGELVPGTKESKQRLKEINKEIARLKKALGEVDGKSSGFKSKLDQLKSGIAGAFGLHIVGRFASQLIKIHAEFEKINISLKVLVGNSAQAEMLWGRITNLALKSPFTIQQLAQSTKQMAAYRIETNKLYSSTKMLADISAGLGVEMSRLILAYGQVKAANFLRGTELRQFSEAGIDMLGQLASYFSEMEGKAVSAADVFERISKRQVLFEDVDAVLRRVTSAGGAFYEMQEKQAQTLAGQISNLKDSIQMMFHDIGTSSHGVLLGIVKIARTIIDSWEVWVPLLAASAASLILIKSTLMAIAAVKAIANLFTTTPILGWSSVAIAGVLAALSYFGIFKDKVEDANESLKATSAVGRVFEEQQHAIEKAGLALAGYTSHINRLKKEQEGLSEEDSRYIQNTNLINQLTAARSSAVAELAGKNSEVASSIGEIIDSEKELIRWREVESKKYAQMSALADAFDVEAEDGKVLKNYIESIKSFYKYSGEALKEYSGKYAEQFLAAGGDPMKIAEVAKAYLTEYTGVVGELEDAIRKSQGSVGSSFLQTIKNIEIGKEGIAKYKEILAELDPSGEGLFFELAQQMVNSGEALRAYAESARDEWLAQNAIEDVSKITSEQEKVIIEYFERIIAEKDRTEDEVRAMRKSLSEAFNFEWELPEFEPTGWQKRYNEWIDAGVDAIGITAKAMEAMNRAFARISKAGAQESKIIEGLKEAVKSSQEIIDAYDSYTDMQKETGVMRYTLEDYEGAQTKKQIGEYLLSFFGQDGEDKNKKGLRDALSSIKEVYKAYKDLREVMSEPNAKAGAWAKYRGMVKEALDKAGIDIDSFIAKVGDMTSEDSVIAALEELKTKAATASDRVAVERAIGEFKLDVKLNLDKTAFEEAMNDAEKLIDGYQLGVELDKLHIPKDFAQQFFDLEAQDLPELRMSIMAEFDGLDIGAEEEKKIKETLRKVDELEAKAQQERLKKYLQYTRNVIGERGKILMEEFDQLQEISKTFVVTNSMALSKGIVTEKQLEILASFGQTIDTLLQDTDENILGTVVGIAPQQLTQLRLLQSELQETGKIAEEAVRRDTMDKLGRFDWNAFKGSETFMSIYSDLTKTAPEALQILVDKMEDHRDQWSKLPIDQVKEYTKLLEQARDAIDKSKAPREIIEKAFEDIKGTGYTSAKDASVAMANAEMEIQRLEQERSIVENIEKMRAEGVEEEEIKKLLTKDQESLLKETTENLDTQKKDYEDIVSNASKYLKSVTSITNAYKALVARVGKFKAAVDKAFEGVDAVVDMLDDDSISKNLVSFAKDMSDIAFGAVELVYQFQEAQVGLQNAANEAEIFGYKMNMAMGVIGWIVMGIQLIAKGLKFAFEAHDKALQKQIDAEIDKVDKLKIAYNDLQKSIEGAFIAADLGRYTREANENLRQQIAATQRMIDAEEDKKKQDDEAIEGWKEDIRDMTATLEENVESAFSTLTDGILDNVLETTRGFVDAWYDAYSEAGNGMKGLEDNFREMLLNMLKQQASMQLISPFIDKYKDWLKEYVDVEGGDSELTLDEARVWAERVRETFPEVDRLLTNWFEGAQSILGPNYGELSDLEKGIQGMTEEQAEVLAAYWNSCRFMLSNIDMTLTNIASAVLGSNSTENPVVSELKRHTEILKTIDSRLESIIGSGDSAHIGSYVKVLA